MKNMDLILAKCHHGQRKKGVDKGPDILASLFSPTRRTHVIYPSEFASWIMDWNSGYYSIFAMHQSLLDQGIMPVLLGGDHSVAVGSVSSAIKKYEDELIVLWIDAHADINTEESSISKNKHGMPVASLMKLNNQANWVEDSKTTIPKLKPEQIIYFGIRDLDIFEVDILNELNITNFNTGNIVLDSILERIKGKKIHISFDVDALDPRHMSSTGTTADGGLDIQTVISIFDFAKQSGSICSIDIVEFNPELGDLKKSLESISSIIKYII